MEFALFSDVFIKLRTANKFAEIEPNSVEIDSQLFRSLNGFVFWDRIGNNNNKEKKSTRIQRKSREIGM